MSATTRRKLGPTASTLDVLLTDAAIGNPAQRAARHPGQLVRAAGRIARHPDRVARRAAGLADELVRVARGDSQVAPAKGDRRFAAPAWERSWAFCRLAQAYLATGEAAQDRFADAELDWRADTMLRFLVGNLHDLLAPTNFVWSNPAVMKETLDQGGANLRTPRRPEPRRRRQLRRRRPQRPHRPVGERVPGGPPAGRRVPFRAVDQRPHPGARQPALRLAGWPAVALDIPRSRRPARGGRGLCARRPDQLWELVDGLRRLVGDPGGELRPARRRLGSAAFEPLVDAPGTYVHWSDG